MNIAESFGSQVFTNEPPNRSISIGASMTITVYATNMKTDLVIVRRNGEIVSVKGGTMPPFCMERNRDGYAPK